jgi:hypothetical protein
MTGLTHEGLFLCLADILPEYLDREFSGRRDLCILATRIAVYVGEYYGLEVRPQACRVLLANEQAAAHFDEAEKAGLTWRDVDIRELFKVDGSHTVGIGFETPTAKWAGHLIATGGGYFADFTIGQGERLNKGIVTGRWIAGKLAPYVMARNAEGTQARYWMFDDKGYRQAPDWKDYRTSRHAGSVIRRVRAALDSLDQEREAIHEMIHEKIG